MDIPVFYWHQNFGFGSRQAIADCMTRLAQLEEQVARAAATISSSSNSSSSETTVAGLRPTAIFVAPEYLFRPQTIVSNTVTAQSCSEQDKDQIVRSLKELSEKFPGIMIFGGTIVWHKAVDKIPSRTLAAAFESLKSTGTPVLDEETGETDIFYDTLDPTDLHRQAAVDRRAKYAQGIANWHALRKSSKPGATPKYFRDSSDMANINGYSQQQTPQQKIAALQSAELRYLVKNTCFVHLNGVQVLKYSKQNDFHEVRQDATIQFVPGSSCPTITVWGHKLAMMICADYNDRLTKSYANVNAIIWVTISDVLSVSTSEKLPPTATKSGFAAHIAAAGDEKGCKLLLREGKSGVHERKLTPITDVLQVAVLSIPLYQ